MAGEFKNDLGSVQPNGVQLNALCTKGKHSGALKEFELGIILSIN
jgi:hypothetical protein